MDQDSAQIPPAKPQNAVSVAIRDGNRFLLVERMNEPSKGLWAFPGGKVEKGEAFPIAAKREVLEETGLIVEDIQLLAILEIGTKYLLHVFESTQFRGTATAMDDAADCGWFTFDEMPDLKATASTMEMVQKILNQM